MLVLLSCWLYIESVCWCYCHVGSIYSLYVGATVVLAVYSLYVGTTVALAVYILCVGTTVVLAVYTFCTLVLLSHWRYIQSVCWY
jgi:hypothetical protein